MTEEKKVTPKNGLPVSKVSSLLSSEKSLQTTWLRLLKTHAKSYPSNTSKQILEAAEFKNVETYFEDLLEELTIGEIGVLYEYSLAFMNPSSRKEAGQYFTPDDVAQWMASLSKKFPPESTWLDPCSGVGNLSYHLASIQGDIEKFITNQLILADRDPLALLIARTIFTLHFHKTHPNLFEALKPRMVEQDFLETYETLPPKISNLKPDYVLVNPPYAPSKDLQRETFQARDKYAYFLELIIKNSKGYISVTPQSYTNSDKFKQLRKLLLQNFNNITIYNFDNIPDSIFKGYKFGSTNSNTANSVRASVIVAYNSAKKNHKITPLLRWRAAERNKLWTQVDNLLTETVLTETIFPKNYTGLAELYDEVKSSKYVPLRTYIMKEPTQYQLIVPTTPRYYITGSKTVLKRSSFKTLYFENATNLNKAYLHINSSLLYWWWRLHDGGMTLSLQTLLTLPINTENTIDDNLVKELEASETVNLVKKKNAGVYQENIKHPLALIQKINENLFDKTTADKLIKVHNNSNLD